MKIINYSNLISTREISDIIDLLGKPYTEFKGEVVVYNELDPKNGYLDIELYFMKNLVIGCYEPDFDEDEQGKYTLYGPGKIQIYGTAINLCLIKGSELFKQIVATCLIHELRHVKQVYADIKDTFVNREKSENDANEFTREQLELHKSKISEILGISDSWSIEDCMKRAFNPNFDEALLRLAS